MISSVRLRGTPQTPLQVQGTKFKKTRSIVKGSNAQLRLKRSLLFAFEASTQTPPPMSYSQNQIMKAASQEPGQQSPDPPDHSSFDFSFGYPLHSTEGNRFSSGLDDLSENLTSMSLISGKYNKTSTIDSAAYDSRQPFPHNHSPYGLFCSLFFAISGF